MRLNDPNPSGIHHKPFSDKCYCIFEVLDSGTWYKVDMTCLRPEFYPEVPRPFISSSKVESKH